MDKQEVEEQIAYWNDYLKFVQHAIAYGEGNVSMLKILKKRVSKILHQLQKPVPNKRIILIMADKLNNRLR